MCALRHHMQIFFNPKQVSLVETPLVGKCAYFLYPDFFNIIMKICRQLDVHLASVAVCSPHTQKEGGANILDTPGFSGKPQVLCNAVSSLYIAPAMALESQSFTLTSSSQ